MHRWKWLLGIALLTPALAACGDDPASTGTGGGGGGGGSPQECDLIDDPGPPGQYADNCVKREWIEPYVGAYTSGNCKLTITTPSGGPAAVFKLELTDAMLSGTYTHDWEGGTGPGNDSYYRFTTDTTFATTKAVNFGVGRKVSDKEEHSIGFRVNGLDTGTPSFTANFQKTILTPLSNTNADCGELTAAP